MATSSNSTDSTQPHAPRPNWNWLQQRLDQNSTSLFNDWMDSQLGELESQFSDYVTPKSLARNSRQSQSDDQR